MKSTTSILLDLQRPSFSTVYAVQDDQLARWIHADLTDGGNAWTPPSGTVMTIRYFKPDGTAGLYDTLENGNSAYLISGSSVDFGLAAQCLTVAGVVLMEISFYNSSAERLSSFSFRLQVEKSPISDAELESNDYFNILAQQIAGVLNATTHPPIIDPTTRNWKLWSESQNSYYVSEYSSVGLTGPAPQISNQVRSWQNSNSGTTVPSGTWSSTRLAGVPGKFLWERVVTTYNNGDSVTEYLVAYQGSDGTGAPGNQTPQPLGTASAGSANAYSREDHIHPIPELTTGGSNYCKMQDGTMIQWGSETVDLTVAANSTGVKAVAFPQSFINTSYIFIVNAISTTVPALRQACQSGSGKAVNWVNVNYQNNFNADWTPGIAWIAIGKWR